MQDGKYVVLAVDDDQDVLDSLRLILEANGYVMIEAGTGEEGVRKYKQGSPDFVLVDLMMEEVDAGTNCVKELKLLGNTVPVYMLSSVGDQLNVTADYASLGLSGIFQKPIDPKRLLSILQAKLG